MSKEEWPQSRTANLRSLMGKGQEQNEGEVPRSVVEQIADMIKDDAPGCPTCSPSAPKGVHEPLKPPPNFDQNAPMFSPNSTKAENLPEPGSGLERLKDKPQDGFDLTGGMLGKGALGRDAGKYTEKLRDY